MSCLFQHSGYIEECDSYKWEECILCHSVPLSPPPTFPQNESMDAGDQKNLAVTKIMEGLDYITLFDADKAARPIGKKTIPIRVNAAMT